MPIESGAQDDESGRTKRPANSDDDALAGPRRMCVIDGLRLPTGRPVRVGRPPLRRIDCVYHRGTQALRRRCVTLRSLPACLPHAAARPARPSFSRRRCRRRRRALATTTPRTQHSARGVDDNVRVRRYRIFHHAAANAANMAAAAVVDDAL